ncbi:MAG TPA: hypothetical protein VFE38_13130, partial [Edaphobacter sp.]|nr:hypothetical protein [Edaphobacter sp.]
MNRRSFMKSGGAGLLAWTASARWRHLFAQTGLTPRSMPKDPVILRSPELEVVLDRKDALPYRYRILGSGINMRGEDLGGNLLAIVCSVKDWKFRPITVKVASAKATGNQADFFCQAAWDNKTAVTFVLRYIVDGPTVHLTMEDVQEQNGFELIQVELPRLATVTQEEDGAWLAHGEEGGSVALLKDAKAGHLSPNRFWGNVLATLPVVMVGTKRAICVL